MLIKSVALALPTYSMSCFRLPNTLCDAIESQLANFWWRNNSTNRGIHWKSWDKLCQPKIDGGMGFRDIQGFNKALLAKQLWRMINKPNSLLARTYKGRYFLKSSPLDAKIGHRPSFAWRSIHSAHDLMLRGLKKEFGNGKIISILTDRWIVDTHPRAPRVRHGQENEDISLEVLKAPESDEWNLPNLSKFFEDSDVKLICQIKPGVQQVQHPFSWIFTKDGEYSIRSGYRVWRDNLSYGDINRPTTEPSLSPLFSKLWSLYTLPKIIHFLWKCLTNCLPTGSAMSIKHLTPFPGCPRCGEEREDTNHILFTCPYARLIWTLSGSGILLHSPLSSSVFSNLASLLLIDDADYEEELRLRHRHWPWIIWRIWKARNDFCFENVDPQPDCIALKAVSESLEWSSCVTNATSNPIAPGLTSGCFISTHNKKWSKPPLDHFKCSVDASWAKDSLKCGVGWLLRNYRGEVLHFGYKAFPQLQSPLEAEATALVWAVTCVERLHFGKVCFETDCSILYGACKKPVSFPRLSSFMGDLSELLLRIPSFSLSLIRRSKNLSADVIAKYVRACPIYFAVLDSSIPNWLRPSVCLDNS